MAETKRWLRRYRVTHLVGSHGSFISLGEALGQWYDPALDQIVHRSPDEPAVRSWSIIELDEPFAEARVAPRARTIAGRRALLGRLSRSDDLDTAWFLAEDSVPERPDARSARLVSWDGSSAEVIHDGPCDLVIARSFDTGWTARSGAGLEQTVAPVDGGFQAVRVEGAGRDRINLQYRPARFGLWITISVLAAAAVPLALAAGLWARIRARRGDARSDPLTG